MNHVLTLQQQQWVDRTLNALSLEHAIAQLFNVTRPWEDPGAWLKILEQLPVGCMSARTKSAAAYQQIISEVQKTRQFPCWWWRIWNMAPLNGPTMAQISPCSWPLPLLMMNNLSVS